MTVSRLLEILEFLADVDKRLGLQSAIESVKNSLDTLVIQPAQPQQQAALANALKQLNAAVEKLGDTITPSQRSIIEEIGGAEFFDPRIAEEVQGTISANAMTPSVARDDVQKLASRRAAFMATVAGAIKGLGGLGIRGEEIEPGTADVAFLIPRDLFKNHLAEFAKELNFINRLIRDFTEATTGQPEPVEIEELSSSVPTVALAAKGLVVEAIAKIVNLFLDAWKKIEEIREIRGKLAKMGLKGAALDELTNQITTKIEEVVEESTTIVMMSYTKKDDARRNELENAVRKDARRLFAQIERGLTVEFRAQPKQDEEDEAGRKVLESIADLSREIEYPKVKSEPMLLESSELLEDTADFIAVSKTTKTQKSTTTKKETVKPAPPEPAQ